MEKKDKIIIGVLIIVFISTLLLVVTGNSLTFDQMIYNTLRTFSSEKLDIYFKIVTSLGNVLSIIIVLAFLPIFLKKREALTCIIISVIAGITTLSFKYLIGRTRPEELRLVDVNGYSFPSGHSMIAFVLYGYLLYLVGSKVTNKWLRLVLQIFLAFLIINICISRIYVGVHYATDVIGGFALGLLILIVAINYSKKNI